MITLRTEITELENKEFTIRHRICDAGTPLEVMIATIAVDMITKTLKELMEKGGGSLEQLWGIRKTIPTSKEGN